MNGNKKSGDELQLELTEYMRDLLKIGKVQRMFYLRLFLCMNAYPNISTDTFNDNQDANLSHQTSSYMQDHFQSHDPASPDD